jgi:hypothetical protein
MVTIFFKFALAIKSKALILLWLANVAFYKGVNPTPLGPSIVALT